MVRVFIGLESINPDSLAGARKKQNKITEYRKMLLAWKHARVTVFAGYILGLPTDTPESILRDIKIIQRELPIDLLQFSCLTPLPGSEDHQRLYKAGACHGPGSEQVRRGARHHGAPDDVEGAMGAGLSGRVEQRIIRPSISKTVMRRAAATGSSPGKVLFLLIWYYALRHAGKGASVSGRLSAAQVSQRPPPDAAD